ncbi:MAG: hypothetical protein HOO86_10370 [Bacteroidales bacterium]|nr:hypothetical protein [Bacteroidales bacterium]
MKKMIDFKNNIEAIFFWISHKIIGTYYPTKLVNKQIYSFISQVTGKMKRNSLTSFARSDRA